MTTTVDRAALGSLTLLGKGGQGRVSRCEHSPMLFKEFLDPTAVRRDRLVALLEAVERMPEADRRRVEAATALPRTLVLDGGAFCGFLMSPAPDGFWSDFGGRFRVQELQYLTYPQRRGWADLVLPTDSWRKTFLLDCLMTFQVLHRAEIVVGDVSMRNLLWSAQASPAAFLLDCDSMSLQGELPAVPAAMTPDWDDPPAFGVNSLDSDRYKMGLVVLRVLTQLPTARPETADLDQVDQGWSARLKDVLAEAATAPLGARPIVERWIDALEDRSRIRLAPVAAKPRSVGVIVQATRPVLQLQRPGS